MKEKDIDAIVIHCSATRAGKDLTAKDINQMHLDRGFNQIGYHYVIRLDGTVEEGRKLPLDGAHCNTKGFSDSSYNRHSVGICYIGGLNATTGKAEDTRTPAQISALKTLVADICKRYNILEVIGHRDTSPDLNNNGTIEKSEFIKECPCFDVQSEFSNFCKNVVVKP